MRVANYSGQTHFLAFRLPNIKATLLVFKSGTIMIAGARHVSELHRARDAVLLRLREYGIKIPTSTELKIGNIVATADVGADLDLEAIVKKLKNELVEYSPEIFPGILYRKPESTLVILLFANGKVVVTGAKSVSQVNEGLEEIKELVLS